MLLEQHNFWLMGGGLVLGMLFGMIAQRSRFCVVAAVSNLVLMRDYRQLHAYLAALAVALLGTTILELGGWVDIAASAYRRPMLNWLGSLGGGLVFGFGAMLAGGCASRTVVRVAEGDLGALIALLAFALTGMTTLFGVLDPVRGWIAQAASTPLVSGDAALSVLVGLPAWILPLSLAMGCLALIVRLGNWQAHLGIVASGALLGLLVPAGWWITGAVGQDDFATHAPASLAIAGPLARGAAYLTTGQVTGTGFAVFLILGVFIGAFGSAVVTKRFRWSPPDGSRVGVYLSGGALMGAGAVLAGGCNIGQGLTGVATGSAGSALALLGILVGLLLGLWRLGRETNGNTEPRQSQHGFGAKMVHHLVSSFLLGRKHKY
ncbi:MAG: YeeE/YedE family protein [Gammaproteobacteria bacterium]|nr:YeeE/YedE family protein [Gammaproteobacteria bacterium]